MIGKMYYYKDKRISPLQLVMLIALREKPMYGYEILKRIREDFKNLWNPQTGSIYPALKRLENHGLIESEVAGETEYYRLTPEGESFISQTLSKIPSDIEVTICYLNILAKAATSIRNETSNGRILSLLSGFDLESENLIEKFEKLTAIREALLSKLINVQEELENTRKILKQTGGDLS